MITTTELIKLLQDNELGGISHKPRKISLTVNGRYLPEPQITISSTGDGICGPEIDFDVDGEWVEPESCDDAKSWIPVSEKLPKIKQHVLLSCYGRVIYGRMISEDGNGGYPVFEICDSVGEKRPVVLETTVHSKYTTSRIKAWMPLPEPYKAESEE